MKGKITKQFRIVSSTLGQMFPRENFDCYASVFSGQHFFTKCGHIVFKWHTNLTFWSKNSSFFKLRCVVILYWYKPLWKGWQHFKAWKLSPFHFEGWNKSHTWWSNCFACVVIACQLLYQLLINTPSLSSGLFITLTLVFHLENEQISSIESREDKEQVFFLGITV